MEEKQPGLNEFSKLLSLSPILAIPCIISDIKFAKIGDSVEQGIITQTVTKLRHEEMDDKLAKPGKTKRLVTLCGFPAKEPRIWICLTGHQ